MSSDSSDRELKIINKHLEKLAKKNIRELDIFQMKDDPLQHYIAFVCPENSRYAGQLHILSLNFAKGKCISHPFPASAPSVYLITKIFHTNISYNGWICVDVLNSAWSPMLGLIGIVEQIIALLDEPSPTGHHLNKDAAEMEQKARSTFNTRILGQPTKYHDSIMTDAYRTFTEKCKNFYREHNGSIIETYRPYLTKFAEYNIKKI